MLNLEHCQKKRVCLVDVDSVIPNLALMKFSSYFKKKGFRVDLKRLGYSGYDHHKREKIVIDGSEYDKVLMSAIFTLNKNNVIVRNCEDVIKGGTGYNGFKPQWLPNKIEHIYPDYNLYEHNEYSIGFLTRGCPNNCKYCFIPKKEGKLKKHSSLKEFYNPKLPKIMLLDNNFLACKDCVKLLKMLKNTGKKVTFKQGLDFRLLTEDKAKLLADLDYDGEYIFAFDRVNDKSIIEKNLKIWQPLVKDWKTKFFVLVGFDTTLEQDLERVYFLKKHRCLPYIMRHSNCYLSFHRPFYTDLAAWCNQPGLFKNLSFKEFLKRRHSTKKRYMETINIIKRNKLNIV